MASSPGATFYPFGDANGTIEERVLAAAHAVTNAQSQLATAVQRVGMTRNYVGEDSQTMLQNAIELYARSVARHEMLCILNSEDFFLAMSRSAGMLKE